MQVFIRSKITQIGSARFRRTASRLENSIVLFQQHPQLCRIRWRTRWLLNTPGGCKQPSGLELLDVPNPGAAAPTRSLSEIR